MMKISTLLAFAYNPRFTKLVRPVDKYLYLLLLFIPAFASAQFTTYNAGQAFTCIAIDSNNNIWAGTNKAGIYLLDRKSNPQTRQFSVASSSSVSTYNIQTLAADQYRNIWAGHNGTGTTGAPGGGIERISIDNTGTVKHYATDRNAECFTFMARDGLASSNSASIAIDKNGTVWSAQKYHDLLVAAAGGVPGQYILTPGSLSFKPASSEIFFSKGTYQDYKAGTDAPELPYPAYTCDPPITQSSQLRNCYAIAYGNDAVIMSVSPYIAKNGQSFPARLLLYGLDGQFLGSYDFRRIGVPITGVFNGIYILPQSGRLKFWATTSTGRILYFDGFNFSTVLFPATIPSSTVANLNAITGDRSGNVYIGTTSGLVVCKANPKTSGITYTLYSNGNGLPSSNVKGVAAERDGTVWLATDGGISKFSPPAFSVYNLVNPVRGDELNANKFQLVSANDKTLQTNGKPIDINIAADSSKTTLIVYTGASPETLTFNIAGAKIDNDAYASSVGKIQLLRRTKDSLVYLYHHPKYVEFGEDKFFTTYRMGLRDSITNEYAVQGNLNVYHAPVLLVHGVWSGVSALNSMKAYLLNNASNYKDYQLSRAWFPTLNHSEPADSKVQYRDKVPGGIDVLLQQCRENGLSAGKVNFVGHSRGGIYGRYYLQNTFSDYPYRNDINTLITINSPHFGSQTANLILDKRKILGLKEVGKMFGAPILTNPEREQGDDPAGAIELQVDHEAVTKDLNGSLLNKNIVPTHAITSQYQFGSLSKADILQQTVVNGGLRVPYVGWLVLFLRLYALVIGTECLEKSVDNCLKEIFSGENSDVVVPISSQRGGLETKAITLIPKNLGHSQKTFGRGIIDVPAVLDDQATQQRVVELLRQDPDAGNTEFTRGGFHPGAQLQYKFLPNLPGDPKKGRQYAGSTLTIDNSLKGKTYKYGDVVPVALTGSPDIKTMLISYSSTSLAEPSSDVEASNTFTFSYPVPKQAAGRVLVVAYGFNEGGLIAIDSSYINIGIPAGVTLDSIRLQKDENNYLQVPARDSISLSVTGYFSDTVRNISYLPGIGYSFITGGVASASAPNNLTGIKPGGYDQLRATYLGKSDTANVLVTDSVKRAPKNSTLPVNFSSFTGNFSNNHVQLFWTTAQEVNNKQFEVQHSTNGSDFDSIGTVAGKGNSSTPVSYSYTTGKFSHGVNYYRLKQVDMDGNFKLSAVVTVSVDEAKQSSVSIYPNPATNRIILAIKQPAGDQLQLQLTNITGQQVWATVLPGNPTAIPVELPKLAKGIYMVRLVTKSGEKLLMEKLIIQ